MTKSKQTYQPADLSIEQLNAIDMLITGKSDAEVAQAVGVARQTVNTWRNKQPEFIAELNSRRKDVWQAQEQRLAVLVRQAVDVLEQAMSSDNEQTRIKAAAHVLKAAGLYGQSLEPVEPDTVAAVVQKQATEALFGFSF